MPSKKIPCEDCEKERGIIEAAGDCRVVSCEKIPDEPGWCLIVWECEN